MLLGVKTALEIASDVTSSPGGAAAQAEAALRRAHASQGTLGAFISILDEAAAGHAARVDERVARGESLPLAGVPLAIKDNLCLAGSPTTAASRILQDFVPPHTAAPVERLLAAGALPVGKANLDEFGMGSTTESSAFGVTANPWDAGRVPGGSSGGSAAAVAAGVVPLALGTDTGGSVRQPASFCGLLGLKPTYGRVSRWGMITLAMSFDQVGILSRSTKDMRLAWDLIKGPDERDSVTVGAARGTEPGASELQGTRVGVIRELAGDINTDGTNAALSDTVGLLESFGATVEMFSLEAFRLVAPAYLVLCSVEASSGIARYDGMTFGARSGEDRLGQERVMQLSRGAGLGPEVRRRVIIGSLALSEEHRQDYYERATRARQMIAGELLAALGRYDVLLSPTTQSPAWELKGAAAVESVRISGYRGDAGTNLANLAGLPAISVPGARAERGLPIGMQFIGPRFGEAKLLQLAGAFEEHYGSEFAPVAQLSA